MKLMLTGGSANGKSTFAEKLALELPGPHYYLAAMKPYGPEALVRIQRHRASHDRQGFQTIERYKDIGDLRLLRRGTLLLECLCNLLDNELFSPSAGTGGDCFGTDHFDTDRSGTVISHILQGLKLLGDQCENLIVVTNDVGSDWPGYSDSTLEYRTALGRLNCLAAASMDAVAEITAGIPRLLRGELSASVREGPRDYYGEREEKKAADTCENAGEKTGFGKGRDRNMLLVIGAEASGKRDYVKSLGYTDEDISSSLQDDCPVLDQLHRLIAREPLDCEAWLSKLLDKRVVICNEVGSGIIPDTREGRLCREQTGRMCVLLARQADHVVRMVCGIPVILK